MPVLGLGARTEAGSSPPLPAKKHWLSYAKNTTHHDPKQSTPTSKKVAAEVTPFEITES